MAPDADTDFAEVFAALLSERGGRSAFSVAQIASARKLAVQLSSDAPASPAIAALLELLPPRTEGEPVDLTVLSDAEFSHLDHLLARARGEAVARPSRRRKRTPRELEAVRLAALLDKVAAGKRAPSALEITEIKNSISAMLYGAAPLPYVLFATSIAAFEQLLAPPPKPAEVAAPAALPSNVTRLPAKESIW